MYAQTATIATNGAMAQQNTQGIVYLKIGTQVQAYATVISPPMGVNWSHDFDPPSGGWPIGDYTCELYVGGDLKVAVNFKVVMGP